MNLKEQEIVNEDFINDDKNYNLTIGGQGGFIKEHSMKGYENGVKNFSKTQRSLYGKMGAQSIKETVDYKKLGKLSWSKNTNRKTYERTVEYKNKMSEIIKKLSIDKRVGAVKGSKHNYPKIRKERNPLTYDKITCPHCNKVGGTNVMKRWHFDNCKLQ